MVQMTGWHTHLADYLKDRRLVGDLLDLVKVPTHGSGSRLAKLGDVANEYLQIAGRRISKSPFEVRKMLKRYPMESVHFKPLEDSSTIRNYSTVLAKLANAIIKSIDGTRNKSGYQFPLSEDDIRHAQALLASLKDGVHMKSQVVAMHTLVQPMLSRFANVTESEDGSSKWSRFIECFIALLSIQDDGSFKPPQYMTQPLAILKYLCRVTCFMHALGHLDGSEKAFEELVEDQVKLHLAPNVRSAFNTISNYQSYISSLVHNTTAAPTTMVSADGQLITYHKSVLDVPRLRLAVEGLAAHIKAQITSLFNTEVFEYSIPDNISDDWTTTARGSSWLDDIDSMVAKPNQLMAALLNTPGRFLLRKDSAGGAVWNQAAVLEVLGIMREINHSLALYSFITAGPDPRGAEFVEHKIRNSNRPRTVFRSLKDLWLVTRRTKAEHLQGAESFIAMKCHPELTHLLEIYLLGIRPLEQILARVAWDEETALLYAEYLWLDMGKVITADTFSELLATFMQQKAGVRDCGLRNFRQLTVEMGRVYLGSEFQLAMEGEDAFAELRGHTTRVERAHYAPEAGHLPSLTSDMVLRFGFASDAWARMMGCFPEYPPMVPLIVKKRNQLFPTTTTFTTSGVTAATPTLDTAALLAGIRAEIANTVTGAVSSAMARVMDAVESKVQKSVAEGVQKALFIAQSEGIRYADSAPQFPLHESTSTSIHPVTPLQEIAQGDYTEIEDLYGDDPPELSAPAASLPPVPSSSSAAPLPPTGPSVNEPGYALDLLRKFFKNPTAEFKSPGQRNIVKHALALENNFVGILPTGGGKSLSYLLPVFKEQHLGYKTIVVVPNKALLQDQLVKAQAFGINALHYTSKHRDMGRSPLVFVALETAICGTFANAYAENERCIKRVVIDEAHQIFTSNSWRKDFQQLWHLADFPVQKVYLTATLPIKKETEFLSLVGARRSTAVLRSPVPQPQIEYHQYSMDRNVVPMHEVIRGVIAILDKDFGPNDKGIVFTQSTSDADKLAGYTHNMISHSKLETSVRADNEHNWMNGTSSEFRWITATTGMIHGVDHPNVVAVVFVGVPYNILNIIQGAGRGGRGGGSAKAILINDRAVHIIDPHSRLDDRDCTTETLQWVRGWGGCHRAVPSKLLDGHVQTCQELAKIHSNTRLCNLCNPNLPFSSAYHQLIQDIKRSEWERIMGVVPKKTVTNMQAATVPTSTTQPATSGDDSDDDHLFNSFNDFELANLDQSLFEDTSASTTATTSTASSARATPVPAVVPPPVAPASISLSVPSTISRKRPAEALPSTAPLNKRLHLTRPSETQIQSMSSGPALPIQLDQAYHRQLVDAKNYKFNKLNSLCKYLNGHCKACWAINGTMVKASHWPPFIACHQHQKLPGPYENAIGWQNLRSMMKYKVKFSYCFHCHLPQGKCKTTGQSWLPSSHGDLSKGDRSCGGLKDTVILAVWHIRNTQELREKACQDLAHLNMNPGADLTAFAEWLVIEEPGNFSNAIELLLWLANYKAKEAQGGGS
ncbi:ATP-dependent DNA helicase sgs1 [Pleurotus ostreatus]|nr:ATP-dependent DNA helicase sgs1 [Pleurotus ostreatus]KAF7424933.1 ATP-dependent DNA helicase sgs1 [Pleurotus ostreatus]